MSRPKNGMVPPNRAFTLMELLVVMGVIAILAALLFPALTGARNRAYESDCANNLKQIGIGLYGYSTEVGNGFFPLPDTAADTNSYAGPHTNLVYCLREYIPSNSPVWHCKRFLRLNPQVVAQGLVGKTTYFYWGWQRFGNTLVPLSGTATTSRWFAVGLSTNVPAAVLMTDRFATTILGDSTNLQYHAGNRLDVPIDRPGTHALLIGGSVIKLSPTAGSVE